jgi:hypothetical protein
VAGGLLCAQRWRDGRDGETSGSRLPWHCAITPQQDRSSSLGDSLRHAGAFPPPLRPEKQGSAAAIARGVQEHGVDRIALRVHRGRRCASGLGSTRVA